MVNKHNTPIDSAADRRGEAAREERALAARSLIFDPALQREVGSYFEETIKKVLQMPALTEDGAAKIGEALSPASTASTVDVADVFGAAPTPEPSAAPARRSLPVGRWADPATVLATWISMAGEDVRFSYAWQIEGAVAGALAQESVVVNLTSPEGIREQIGWLDRFKTGRRPLVLGEPGLKALIPLFGAANPFGNVPPSEALGRPDILQASDAGPEALPFMQLTQSLASLRTRLDMDKKEPGVGDAEQALLAMLGDPLLAELAPYVKTLNVERAACPHTWQAKALWHAYAEIHRRMLAPQ